MGLGFKNYFYWMRLVMLLSDIHDVKDGRLITKDTDSWIGIDLDGTLAEYHGFEGLDVIGKPIQKMVDYVKVLLEKGEKVKIFTARIADHPECVGHIQQWLQDVGLPILEVTNIKDPGMTTLIDDRARQVVENTGEFVDSLPSITFQGLPITIENAPGSIHKGVGPNGQFYESKVYYQYGYFQKTKGTDGDEIDCFVGPDKNAEEVYIIWEKLSGEDKVMLGFSTKMDAIEAFCAHYTMNTNDFLGEVTVMSMDDFKKTIQGHKKGTRIK